MLPRRSRCRAKSSRRARPQPARTARATSSSSAAQRAARARRVAGAGARPGRLARPGAARGELVERVREASGLPVGLYCQGAAGAALAAAIEAARGGCRPDRLRRSIRSRSPLTVSPARRSSQALSGIGLDTGVDVDVLWEACELVDSAARRHAGAAALPRIAVRAAEHKLPVGLVAELDASLRAHGFVGPPRRGARRADRVRASAAGLRSRRRSARCSPRRRSSMFSRRSAGRSWWTRSGDLSSGRYGRTPAPGRSGRACARSGCCGDHRRRRRRAGRPGRAARETRRGLLRARRSCCCSRSSARKPSPCSERSGAAGGGTLAERSGCRQARDGADPRADQSRAGVRDRRGHRRGGGDAGHGAETRGARRAGDRRSTAPMAISEPEPTSRRRAGRRTRSFRVESPDGRHLLPRASPGSPPFVEEGDVVTVGPDALHPRGDEAHERGQGRDDGRVRRDLRRERAARQYGDLLFELEPLNGRPLDAL